MKKFVMFFVNKILLLINYLYPKDEKRILAFVGGIKGEDGKLHPYKDDNGYIFCQYIKNNHKEYEIDYVVEYLGVHENSLKDKLIIFKKALRCRYVVSKHFHFKWFFNKKQRIINIGYFTPFKADRLMEKMTDMKYGENFIKDIKMHSASLEKLDYNYITTSDYSSLVIAASYDIRYDKMYPLGFPRNDLIHEVKIDINKIFGLKKAPDNVIIFAPTFRDKYLYTVKNSDNNKSSMENVFGYHNINDELQKLLEESNSIIVFKPHQYFDENTVEDMYNKNILPRNVKILTENLMKTYEFGIYDLFSSSDCLISDYSSISFDYLLMDKPLIFNVHDIEEYRNYRGLAFEPMEYLMPGHIVKTKEGFLSALRDIINHKDEFKEERMIINKIVNKFQNSGSCERIYRTFFEN